ncbi:nucleoid-associated protein [Acinetobacter baumannii]|uniref:nucleoid-associated protein n=1 Tax=Acinetobacter baumannii TaxID=470 RepID=UPI000571D72A|nr:nucleoid-associated protein [Acinetobacter baumannii]QTM20914.1 nucleoid-associated protein [Acinetobacter baumannii]TPU29199.1 nucleoid-associated protein [Acinetobacter baumannii]
MLDFKITNLDKFVVHHVGNKGKGDGLIFSENQKDLSNINLHLVGLINRSFVDEKFNFYFESDLDLNPVYSFVKKIFNSKDSFHDQTKNISRFLYEQSTHASIKPGELCFSYIEKCTYNGNVTDCLVIFKSENKENILNIRNNEDGIFLEPISGIGLNKIEKGCLVINLESEKGYAVYLVNNLLNNNIKYWNDDFLHICQESNSYLYTKNYLNMVCETVDNVYSDNQVKKIDVLTKTLDYFENNNNFNKLDFIDYLADSSIDLALNENSSNYFESNIADFKISKNAIKKQKKAVRKSIKLDDNFEIFINKNQNLIEQGIDSKGKFYKIYYQND